MSKTGLLAFMLVVMFVTSLFGTHFGATVNGGFPAGTNMTAPNWVSSNETGWTGVASDLIAFFDNIATFLGWLFGLFLFTIQMATFQVDGMPVFISGIFLIMSVLCVWLFVGLIRGTGG